MKEKMLHTALIFKPQQCLDKQHANQPRQRKIDRFEFDCCKCWFIYVSTKYEPLIKDFIAQWIGVSRPDISFKGDEIPGNLPPLWQGFTEEILNEFGKLE